MIKPLTSLRFFFAIMVFFHHLGYLEDSNSDNLKWLYNNILHEGYIGVSFFFILSGFILSYNYQDKFLKNKKSKKEFYIARIARIYPLHILTFIFSIPLTLSIFASSTKLWFAQALANLTLTQSYFPAHKIYWSFNGVSWSISDELFFYLMFPFLVILISRLIANKKNLFLLFLAVIPLLSFIIPESYHESLFYINPFFRINDFILGILVYNLFASIKVGEIGFNFSVLECVSLLMLISFVICHPWVSEGARYSFYYWIPMSSLILVFAFQKGIISKFLSNKILMYLGEISFGFYMIHQLVMKYYYMLNDNYLHIENIYFNIFLMFVFSLIASHLSYLYYETPINRYIKNRSKKVLQNKKSII